MIILMCVIKFWDLLPFVNFTSTCFTLLCVPGKHTNDITSCVDDSFALVSRHNDNTHLHKSGKGRHKCDHYGKLDNKIDRCYFLHGHPPRFVGLSKLILCNLLLRSYFI